MFKRGGLGQRIWFALWRVLWRRRQQDPDAVPRRVALLRFDRRVGEVLLQTSMISLLKKNRPQLEIIAVVHPCMAGLLQNQPAIDRVVSCDLRGFPFRPGSWQSLFRLAVLRVDITIDCSNYTLLSTTHAMAAMASRAPTIIGFKRPGVSDTLYSHCVQPLAKVASERRQRLHLLTALGIEDKDQPTRFTPCRALSPEVAALEQEIRAHPGGFAIINPGGRLDWRRVPLDLLVVAARQLIDLGRQPVVVWGPGEREIALELCVRVGTRARLAPPTSIDQLATLFAAAGCTVTSNSGPMHLSIATGAPTLAIFVAMSPDRWGEPRPPHAVADLRESAAPEKELREVVDRFVDGLIST